MPREGDVDTPRGAVQTDSAQPREIIMEKIAPYKSILLFGEPGAGKGTQGRVLGRLPGFLHCSCGDVFRRLDPNSALGKQFLKYSSRGLLVPDSLTIQLCRTRIHALSATRQFLPNAEILVLDGIPRNLHQAEMMVEYIDVILLVLLESANEEALVARIRRRALHENRLDDASEDVIRGRLKEYKAETEPLLDFYPEAIIRRVDADQEPIGVLQSVATAIRDVTTCLTRH